MRQRRQGIESVNKFGHDPEQPPGVTGIKRIESVLVILIIKFRQRELGNHLLSLL
jgi:hypothetical protein